MAEDEGVAGAVAMDGARDREFGEGRPFVVEGVSFGLDGDEATLASSAVAPVELPAPEVRCAPLKTTDGRLVADRPMEGL